MAAAFAGFAQDFGAEIRPLVHFVGFSGAEYLAAVRVWGRPDYIHRGWDRRAQREIAPGDTVVFATGPHDQAPRVRSFDDLREDPAGDETGA